jgi:predicted metal-binding protein
MKEEKLIELCLHHGAHKAFVLDVNQITFDENLRTYCEMNTCGTYGKNHACPPSVGTPAEVIKEAKSFSKALVYQTITMIEDSFDFAGMEEANRKHEEVSGKIHAEVTADHPKYLELRAGGCKVCPQCAIIDDKPCRYPAKKRSSLEAYCMNVSDLAEKCEMNYINGPDSVTYFGAFLI